jgi:hypothetical protein
MAQTPRRLPYAGSAAAILTILTSPLLHAQTATPGYPASPYPPTPYPGNQPAYPAQPSPLQAGGLTPPSAQNTPSPGESETYRQLDRAEREDAGRGLEFVWVEAESGYEYVSLDGISSDGLVDGSVISPSGSALLLGAGAGVRLIFLTIGARFRFAEQSAWDLWTLNAEVGLHLPLGVLEPSFTLSAGYASVGAFEPRGAPVGFEPERVDISGFDTRLGAALDWYINPLLSLGARAGVELLILGRSRAAQPALASTLPALAAGYARAGDGIGIGVSASAVAGLHF